MQAEAFALSSLDELSIDATPQQIESAIETSLAGKLDKGMEKHLANLSLEAGQVILSDGRADPTRVKIIKQTGGTMQDSTLILDWHLQKAVSIPK